jgi:hypothetical protein
MADRYSTQVSSIKRGASQVPDQLAANCLAAFVEAVEEMRCEPYFGEDDPCKITEQAGAVTYTLGDRFHFRSALVTFRRVWLNDEASALPHICGLLDRYEGGNFMVETTHVTLLRKDRMLVSTKPAVEFFDSMLRILQTTLVAPC